MASKAFARTIQRRFDNERVMLRHQYRVRKIDFAKRLAKAIGIGLFAYITMVTEQVAGWIALPAIMWSLCYGANAVDKFLEWRWTPWQR